MELPERLATITNKKYKDGLSVNNKGNAYLQAYKENAVTANFKYQNGSLTNNGSEISVKELGKFIDESIPVARDYILLQVMFSVVLHNVGGANSENVSLDKEFAIYYPDLVRMLGGASNVNKKDFELFLKKLTEFYRFVGIIDGEIYPVIARMESDYGKKVVRFSCPYLIRLIQKIYLDNINRKKDGSMMLKSDGAPYRKASEAYSLYASVYKHFRRKAAITNANIIIALIAQAGSGGKGPHIKVQTILERNPELKQMLDNQKDNSNRNKLLKSIFMDTWEILRDYTDLKQKYKNIVIPKEIDGESDPVPTCSKYDMVFNFPHDGKT